MTLGSNLLTKNTAYKDHLSKGRPDGLGGELAKVRSDLVGVLAAQAAFAVEEYDDPRAAAVDNIKLSIATVAAAVVYVGSALNGVLGGVSLVGPRLISVTQATGNHYAGSVTIKGLDAQSKIITEDVVLTAAPGIITTTATTKYFKQVTEIDVPAQQDALGALQFGTYGDNIGVARKLKARTAALFIRFEAMDGSALATGALISAASAPPYGAYTPAAAPTSLGPAAVTGTADITPASLYGVSTHAILTGTTDSTAAALYGAALAAILTGTADITAAALYGAAQAAVLTGIADITAGSLYGLGPGTLDGETLTMNVDGAGATTLTFDGNTNSANEAAMLAAVLGQWPALASAVAGGGGGNKLVLTTTAVGAGPAASIVVTLTAGSGALGISGTANGVAKGTLDTKTLTLNVDNAGATTLTLDVATNVANEAALLSAILIQWPALASAVAGGAGGTKLVLTTTAVGAAPAVSIVVSVTTGATALGVSGTANGRAIGTLDGESLTLGINGGGATTLVLSAATNAATAAALRAAILIQWATLASAVAGGSGGTKLVLTTTLLTTAASIAVTGTTAATALGLTGTVTGSGDLHTLTLIATINGVAHTLTFNGATNALNEAAMLAAIHALWATLTATQGGGGANKLVLTDSVTGPTSTISVGAGTANTKLGTTGLSSTGGGHQYAIMYEYDPAA